MSSAAVNVLPQPEGAIVKKSSFVASIAGGVIALASLGGVGVFAATGGFEPVPEQTPTAVVVTVEENTLRQEVPDVVLPTVVIPPAPIVEAPKPAPEPEPEAWVNEDGSVEGDGCPAPYVDNGYGCQVPICGVDADGNDIPCQG